jgi:DNA-binding CsgD family transcriptional regulator
MAITCSVADRPAELAEVVARPDYFGRVGEVVRRIPMAVDEAEAVELLSEAAERMGADSAIFGSFVRDDPTHESYRFLLACDPLWCLEYERHAWYPNDAWLDYAKNHSEPVRASEIPVESREQCAIAALAAEHGFRSAVVVPAPSSGRLTRMGVLCLGSSMEGYFESEGFASLRFLARALAMELHEWWIGRIKQELVVKGRITDEDLLLLRLERQGLSTKEIAAQLGVSDCSINSRFQRVTTRLCVPNRRAAAAMAAEYGLI